MHADADRSRVFASTQLHSLKALAMSAEYTFEVGVSSKSAVANQLSCAHLLKSANKL